MSETKQKRGLTDGHGEDGTDSEEVERGDDHSSLDRVFSLKDGELGEQKDNTGESSRESRSDKDTGKDGGDTLGVVPSPLNGIGTSNGDTGTCQSGYDRIGGRDGKTVVGCEHEPRCGYHEGTGKGEHLNTGVVLED